MLNFAVMALTESNPEGESFLEEHSAYAVGIFAFVVLLLLLFLTTRLNSDR